MLQQLKFTDLSVGLMLASALLFPQHIVEAQPQILEFAAQFPPVQDEVITPRPAAKQTITITVTAYNSEVGQTDSTPFITAFGTTVRDGIIATNYLPRGTQVRFPDIYGDKIFVVEDRMNIRYHKRADIWMAEHAEAVQFGIRTLKMEIL